MNKLSLLLLSALTPAMCVAQAVTEKKNIRIIEHHSSAVNNGAPFGNKANGDKAGYDFVKRQHHSSFNPATYGKWGATEAENLDFVEHNSKYGNGGPFGITSAVSSIWGGDIVGNNKTIFAEAPAGFNYEALTDVNAIQKVYPANATKAIAAVAAGKVYLLKIRNTDMYVAMKVTAVKNVPTNFKGGDTASVYFDFDYKYGTFKSSTAVNEVAMADKHFSIVPNPARGSFQIMDVPASFTIEQAIIRVTDITGKMVYEQPATSRNIIHQLNAGTYFITLSNKDITILERLVITE